MTDDSKEFERGLTEYRRREERWRVAANDYTKTFAVFMSAIVGQEVTVQHVDELLQKIQEKKNEEDLRNGELLVKMLLSEVTQKLVNLLENKSDQSECDRCKCKVACSDIYINEWDMEIDGSIDRYCQACFKEKFLCSKCSKGWKDTSNHHYVKLKSSECLGCS